jgi:hypothetical protein
MKKFSAKYLKYVLLIISLIPIGLTISVNKYYSYNRVLYPKSIPDSALPTDCSTIYYRITDQLFFLFLISFIPAIAILLLINRNVESRSNKGNLAASILYVVSILILGALSGKAFTYFFD